LAVGGHLKNTVAEAVDDQVIMSQHLGDLDTAPAVEGFKKALTDLRGVYPMPWQAVACDMHPDYHSTHVARNLELPVVVVQHHHAHVRACMAENELTSPVLGVAWDGTGCGEDKTIWGGEFLVVSGKNFTRVATFRGFRLPGGDRAAREPRRGALGLLYELLGERLFDQAPLIPLLHFTTRELKVMRKMLRTGLNSPWTSSVGRIFDALASIVGFRQRMQFEGQAAMEVEFALEATDMTYPFELTAEGVVDWGPMLQEILKEVQQSNSIGHILGKFHNTLAEIIVAVAQRIGIKQVVLTGGCFQNVRLLEKAVSQLRATGFQPFWHQRIPPNDGGIALGQIMAAAAMIAEE
jgi:hydrogenase maturation protein HypF